jgi:hypothetical protein
VYIDKARLIVQAEVVCEESSPVFLSFLALDVDVDERHHFFERANSVVGLQFVGD